MKATIAASERKRLVDTMTQEMKDVEAEMDTKLRRTVESMDVDMQHMVAEDKAEAGGVVAKADRVLASAIQRAVLNGEPVDALSADKKAYLKGGALHVPSKSAKGRARRDLSRARKPKPKTRRSR